MGKKSKSKQIKKKNHPNKANNNDKKRVIFKPKSMTEFQNAYKVQPSQIKNKQKRNLVYYNRKAIKNQIKVKQRKERKKLPKQQRQQPITIEDKQIGQQQFVQQYSEQCLDQFNKFFNKEEPIKILITTCLKPHIKIYDFIKQLMIVFHNVAYYPRRTMKLNEIYQYAKDLEYTHVVIVRYTHGWQLLIRCLNGPLAIFRVSSVEFQKDIHHHAVATDHYPQLILNNFDSRVGVRVGRLLGSMFPQSPQFKGRRVVTFHNQRDFIFFRHHRYIFKEGFDGVHMQQIGPRFTLRLMKLYSGDEDQVKGLQFQAKDNMYVDRAAVYL